MAACGAAPTPAAQVGPGGEFKMKSYFLVLLHRGPGWSAEPTPASKALGEGHMANINAMARTGKLVLAGPTDVDAGDKTAVAGIFLFDVADRGQVEALLKGDPAIAAQRFTPEILPWYGPAGITYPGKR
ncbi:MAG: hypothetical protein H6Q90_5526 [Deltaproteobacteria bacterium]|nr:hypothetical protein [Deltaproteobacteria bacterium]